MPPSSSNSVAETYTDDGDPYGGKGGALHNTGSGATVLFKRLAIFKDNVGSLVSGQPVVLVDVQQYEYASRSSVW